MAGSLWTYFLALMPFLGGLLIFYVIMRAIFNADRDERVAVAQWEKEHSASHSDSSSNEPDKPEA